VKAVVLCADDFGLSEGVSRGILDLIALGRLSATSAMTNIPAWDRLAPALRDHGDRVGVGLHLTLTAGAPLGPMPQLAPGGALPKLADLAAGALRSGLPLDEIETEIGRQFDAFADAFGRTPDFVDGHQHVHVMPGVRRALFAALRRRGCAGSRLWLRDPSDRLSAIARRGVAAAKAVQVRALAAGFRRAARQTGFGVNEGFSGFSLFEASAVAATFESAFRHLGPRPVVMCHPGYPDEDLRRLDPVVEVRRDEFDYLASDAFVELLAARELTLAPRPE
jgi:chitin disaccharide deacetylase